MTEAPPRLERLSDNHTVLYLEGGVNVDFLNRFKESCLAACEGGRLVVDLCACEYLDSSGLGLLVSMNRKQKAAGGTTALRQVPEHLRSLLETTRLMDLFERE